jgi:cation diffusion facilitator CzcD-associated flavoprotein CzcO
LISAAGGKQESSCALHGTLLTRTSVTPGEGYLEALQEDNVEMVRTGIKEISREGVVTVDGKTHEVDVIIAATGYDTSYTPAFQLIGRNGVDLAKRWAVTGAEAYFTCAIPDMPNYFSKLPSAS